MDNDSFIVEHASIPNLPSREQVSKNQENLVNVKSASKKFETQSKLSDKKQNLQTDKSYSMKRFQTGTFTHISNALGGNIFSGWVSERQLVEKLNGYRDIIEVDEWEESLNLSLKEIVNSIPGVKEEKKWINITAPKDNSPCYRLWVLLKEIPTPGHYWFKIESISSDEHFGLTLTLSILRPVHEFDGESLQQRNQRLQGEPVADEWNNFITSLSNTDFKSIFISSLSCLTPSNISLIFRLIIMVAVIIVISLGKFLMEMNNFTIKLIREFGILMQRTTPLFQSILHFIEKIFGGFYLLIAMVYRDARIPRGPPPPPRDLPPLPPAPVDSPPRYHSNVPRHVPQSSWRYRDQ